MFDNSGHGDDADMQHALSRWVSSLQRPPFAGFRFLLRKSCRESAIIMLEAVRAYGSTVRANIEAAVAYIL